MKVTRTLLSFSLLLGLASPAAAQFGLIEQGAKRAKQRPIVEKESHKWLAALRETITITPSELRLVTIADREADTGSRPARIGVEHRHDDGHVRAADRDDEQDAERE